MRVDTNDCAKPKDVESITIKPGTCAWVRLLNSMLQGFVDVAWRWLEADILDFRPR